MADVEKGKSPKREAKMRKPSLRVFLQNLYSLFVYDSHRFDLVNRNQLFYLQQREKLLSIKVEMMDWLFKQGGADYSDYPVFENIFHSGFDSLVQFPYKQIKTAGPIEAKIDRHHNLPYVIHKGKRLYYPSSYSLKACEAAYRFLIEKDQILEGGYLEKAPHCYQSEQFKVEKGDVLLDGGAAEGLFALEMIDTVSFAYLVEADAKWIPSLKATFAPYADKVKIVNKYLSDCADNSNTTITELLSDQPGSCFVKMDIEGAEPHVIKGCSDFLGNRDNIKLVCCSYHYQTDESELVKLFDENGYSHEFSDGWFFFAKYDNPMPPYFRHALVRAKKK